MSNKVSDKGRFAKALLEEYPTAGSLTLAKRLHRDYPEHFETVETARMLLRYYRGAIGVRARKQITDLTHVKDIEKTLRDKFDLPESAVSKRNPYIIPKFNDRILVLGDCHFPYQNNKGILAAIEYGIQKDVNCIILNGDMVDLYQISRYSKDGRKPNVEYELEMYWQFLIDLRETFPNALIIWKFGNHEERYDNYMKNNAPLLDMIATESLEDYYTLGYVNVIVVKDKRRIVCGDLNILHGHEFTGGAGSVNPARAMFLKARANVLVNHFHRSSSHKGNDLNGKQIHTFSLGGMCSPQDYLPYGDHDCSFAYLRVVKGVTFVNNREV